MRVLLIVLLSCLAVFSQDEIKQVTFKDKYKQVSVADTKLKNGVSREYISYDTTGAFSVGDSMTVLLLKNGKVIQSITKKFTEPPFPPNDAIATVFHVYCYDDRIAPLDTVAIESVIAKKEKK